MPICMSKSDFYCFLSSQESVTSKIACDFRAPLETLYRHSHLNKSTIFNGEGNKEGPMVGGVRKALLMGHGEIYLQTYLR